jgi:hypothetical protein
MPPLTESNEKPQENRNPNKRPLYEIAYLLDHRRSLSHHGDDRRPRVAVAQVA